MIFVCIALTVVILILSALLILYIREVYHLLEQIEQIKSGSQIELSTNTRNPAFLMLYRKLNQTLDASRRQIQKYTHSQNQLKRSISDIAHDIRTPLTSASGYLQMLEDCTECDRQLRYEHIIEQRIDELKDMLEELFLYTKLTSDDFVPDCQSVAVFPILSDCMIGLYHVFEDRGIEPDVCFENEDVCVSATPEILGRIFRNLVNNALLHGDGGLRIVQTGTSFLFANPVKDAGSIDTGRLFDRFYKADKSRQKGSSGLGLSIVQELVMRIGGTIEASILEGRTLNISITFLPGKRQPF